MIVAEFADPARLAVQGVTRSVPAARRLGGRLTSPLVTLCLGDAALACRVLALLTSLDAQVADAEAEVTRLLPTSL